MEDKLKVGGGMGPKSKKSTVKKKKSSGKGSKPQLQSQPEAGMESVGAEVEEVEAEKASVQLESSSSSKKRKSEGEEEEGKEIPQEVKSGAGKRDGKISGGDQALSGKEKKLKSGSGGGRLEPPTSGATPRQLRPRKVPKVFQDVILGEGDVTRVIGKRIKVFWPLDNKWYSGQVKSFDVKKKRHHVLYDDGDEEWLELKKERVKILAEPGEVFGGSGDGGALQSDAPTEKESGVGVERRKGGKSADDMKKNGVKDKEKESDGGGNGKKSGAKRKQVSAGDNKKNNGKRKKEGEEEMGKEEEKEKAGKEEIAKNGKLEEEKGGDGGRKEEDERNAVKNKVEEDQNAGQLDDVVDAIKRKDAEEKKGEAIVTKDSGENEDQATEDDKNAKRPKSSKRTAPRTKRGGSGKQTQQKATDEERERVEHSETKQDVKRDEDSRVTENVNSKEASLSEVDANRTEKDTVDEMGAKHSTKDVRKQSEKLDEKNSSPVDGEQLEEEQKAEVLKQANEDEPIRPLTDDQTSVKHSEVRESDEKSIEKQVDVKDTDQLSKKHSKKHRGKVKPRELGKR